MFVHQRFTSIWVSLENKFQKLVTIKVELNLSLSPGEVGPLIVLDLPHTGIVLVISPGGVGHSDLVTFVDLGRTTLPTARPAAVGFAVALLIAHHLKGKV